MSEWEEFEKQLAERDGRPATPATRPSVNEWAEFEATLPPVQQQTLQPTQQAPTQQLPPEPGWAQRNLFPSVFRGLTRSQQTEAIVSQAFGVRTDEGAAAKAAELQRTINANPMPPESQEALRQFSELFNGGNYWEALGTLARNPGAMASIIGESFGQFLPTTAAGAAGAVGAAALGVPGLGIRAVLAGITGLGSLKESYGSKFLELLSDKGVNLEDPNAIVAALQGEQSAELKAEALRYGIPVAAFDALSAGIAGTLVQGARTARGAVGRGAVEALAIQPGLGAAGEASGQLSQRGEVYDPSGVALEAIAEFPTGAAEVGIGSMIGRQGQQPEEPQAPAPLQEPTPQRTASQARDLIRSLGVRTPALETDQEWIDFSERVLAADGREGEHARRMASLHQMIGFDYVPNSPVAQGRAIIQELLGDGVLRRREDLAVNELYETVGKLEPVQRQAIKKAINDGLLFRERIGDSTYLRAGGRKDTRVAANLYNAIARADLPLEGFTDKEAFAALGIEELGYKDNQARGLLKSGLESLASQGILVKGREDGKEVYRIGKLDRTKVTPDQRTAEERRRAEANNQDVDEARGQQLQEVFDAETIQSLIDSQQEYEIAVREQKFENYKTAIENFRNLVSVLPQETIENFRNKIIAPEYADRDNISVKGLQEAVNKNGGMNLNREAAQILFTALKNAGVINQKNEVVLSRAQDIVGTPTEIPIGTEPLREPLPEGGEPERTPAVQYNNVLDFLEQKRRQDGTDLTGGPLAYNIPALQREYANVLDRMVSLNEAREITKQLVDDGMLRKRGDGWEPTGKRYALENLESRPIPSAPEGTDIFTNYEMRDEFGDDETREIRFGVDVERILAEQASSNYNGRPMELVSKELGQNSYDAIKIAKKEGTIERGKIQIIADVQGRSVTVIDNGSGMTPEILEKAYFQLSGSNKGNLAPEERSGGFGKAKIMLFSLAEEIEIVTTRNGTQSSLKTTGADVIRSLTAGSSPIKVNVRRNWPGKPPPNGTTVRITFPETLKKKDYDGNDVDDPVRIDPFDAFFRKYPLLDNTEIEVYEDFISKYERNDRNLEALTDNLFEFEANVNLSDYPNVVEKKFDWGTAKLYYKWVPKDRVDYANVRVYSSGIGQFERSFQTSDDVEGETLPIKAFLDVRSLVDATNVAKYPFTANRQNFSPEAQQNIRDIEFQLRQEWKIKQAENDSATKKASKVINEGKIVGTIEDFTDPDYFSDLRHPSGITPELHVQSYAKIVYSALTIPENDPLLYGPSALAYYEDLLEVYQDLVREVGWVDQSFTFDMPVGVMLDYHTVDGGQAALGLHVASPARMMLLNPYFTKASKSVAGEATSMVGTMLHEMAHSKVWNHGQKFTSELDNLYVMLADNGIDRAAYEKRVEGVLRKHGAIRYAGRDYIQEQTANGNFQRTKNRLKGSNQLFSDSGLPRPDIRRDNSRGGTGGGARTQAVGSQRVQPRPRRVEEKVLPNLDFDAENVNEASAMSLLLNTTGRLAELYPHLRPVALAVDNRNAIYNEVLHQTIPLGNAYMALPKESRARVFDRLAEGDRLKKKPDTTGLNTAEAKAVTDINRAMNRTFYRFLEHYVNQATDGKVKPEPLFMLDKDDSNFDKLQIDEVALRKSHPEVYQNLQKFKKQINLGYIPHMRQGSHFVAAYDKDGALIYYERFDPDRKGKTEASIKADIRRKYPKATRISNAMRMNVSLYNRTIAPTESLFEQWLSITQFGKDPASKKALEQLSRRVAAANANIFTRPRGDIDGWLTDRTREGYLERNLPTYFASTAHRIASTGTTADFKQAINKLQRQDPRAAEWANKLNEFISSPQESFATLRSIAFFGLMGGAVDSMVMNLTQLPLNTLPILARYTNTATAMKHMTSAFGTVLRNATSYQISTGFVNMDKLMKNLPADERQLIAWAAQRGLTSPVYTNELRQSVTDFINPTMTKIVNKLLEFLAAFFSGAEQVNRLTTLLASYRMAKSDPLVLAQAMKFEQATQFGGTEGSISEAGTNFGKLLSFSADMVQQTQFLSYKGDKPYFMRAAPILELGTQFMYFPWRMAEVWTGALRNSLDFKKLDKPTRRMAAKQFFLLNMAVLMFAGALGVPFGESLRRIIEMTLRMSTGFETDIKKDLQQLLTPSLGPEWAHRFVNGLSQDALGVSIGQRLLIDPIPIRNIASGQVQDMVPAVSFLYGAPADAMRAYQEGKDTWSIFSNFLPRALKNMMVGAQSRGIKLPGTDEWLVDPKGVTTAAGTTVLPGTEMTPNEQVAMMTGFTPTRVARARELLADSMLLNRQNKIPQERAYEQLSQDMFGMIRSQQANSESEAERFRASFTRTLQQINAHNARHANDPSKMININMSTLRQRVLDKMLGVAGPGQLERRLDRANRSQAEQLREMNRI